MQREREQLEWQVRELETLGFSTVEWDALNIEHKRLGHAASLVEGARFSLDLLAEGDAACEQQVDIVARRLGPSASAAQIDAEWPRWYAANRARIGADPDLIRPGLRLVVPSDVAS